MDRLPLGHAAGDQLLKAVAERLTACIRGADTVCRYGGDEFVIMLPEIDGPDTAVAVVTKVRDHLGVPFLIDGHKIRATASIGIAFYPEDGQTYNDLMKHADVAMYRAKSHTLAAPCQSCLDLKLRNQTALNGTDPLGKQGLSLRHDAAQFRGVEGFARTVPSQVEAALHPSEEQERVPAGDKNGVHSPLLFEHNPLPAWILDPETLTFLAVNDAAVSLYGYTREALLSMTIKGIYPAADTPALLRYAQTIPQEVANAGVWKHRKKDGTLLDVEVLWHELLFQGRRAIRYLANDVTARKHAETLLLAHERALRTVAEAAGSAAETANYAKDEFLVTLAHELRAPLAAILGWTQVLQAGDAQAALQVRALAAIEQRESASEACR
jgi:PAS domain S-box-containing protein